MLRLGFRQEKPGLRLLCIGAHSDDLEIGCGGTILEWLATYQKVEVTWVVLSAQGRRAIEARKSAQAMLRKSSRKAVLIGKLRDGYFPAQIDRAKRLFEGLKARPKPDVVLTHHLADRHQDHRVVAELTWQTFRDHLILEYEIPKYEGDLGQPNFYVPLSRSAAQRKVEVLLSQFKSQRPRRWFDSSTFESLMHLRAMECRAESGFAEGFQVRKCLL